MRIEFPHAAREDFRWAQNTLCIGSAPGNDLVLAAAQAAPRHLRIKQDRRGWVLEVLDGDRIYVNARPVRERALLRAGDVLSVGDCRLLLCADEDPARRTLPRVGDTAQHPVALRAVAGPLSGRVLALDGPQLTASRGNVTLELARQETVTMHLGWRDGQLRMEVRRASLQHPFRVNGVAVQSLALQPGDQIGVAMHRLVVEAPGMCQEPATPVSAPHPAAHAAPPVGGMVWLILTAVILGLGIALALWLRL